MTPMEVLSWLDGDTPVVKQPGQWRRQGDNGPPMVSDPDGTAVQSGPRKGEVKLRTYSRPSNFGKQVENTYNLEKWNERMVALGMVADEEVGWELARILAETADRDSREFKSAVDGIVVEAKRRAGAMVKAEQGTHGHAITEDHDLDRSVVTRIEEGEDVGLPAEVQVAVAEAWAQLLATYDLEVLAVEFACVCDQWRVGGTGDRIVRLRRDLVFTVDGRPRVLKAGTVLVLDIKTGGLKTDREGRPNYWLSYAVQVCAYALSVPYDVDTERRGEWPWTISHTDAIIAHLDIGRALETGEMVAQLVYVDLVAGHTAGDLVCEAKDWQRRKDVFSPVGSHVVTVPVVVADSMPTVVPPSRESAVRRARALVDAGHGNRLALAWPPGVAGLKSDHEHTDDELDAILTAIRRVEDDTSQPFHADDAPPPPQPPQTTLSAAVAHVAPEEGAHVDDDTYAALKAAYSTLAEVDQFRLALLGQQADEAGHPFKVTAVRSVRRWSITRALVACCRAELDDDDIRDLVSAVTNEELQPAVPLAAAVGSLTIEQAELLEQLATL